MPQQMAYAFGRLGRAIALRPCMVLVLAAAIGVLCSLGLLHVDVEMRLEKLWAEEGGRLTHELAYCDRFDYVNRSWTSEILIATERGHFEDGNVVTRKAFLEMLAVLDKVYNGIVVPGPAVSISDAVGAKRTDGLYSLDQVCVKVPVTLALVKQIITGALGESQAALAAVLAPSFVDQIQAAMPCIRVSPMDCFKEGNFDFGGMPELVNLLGPLAAAAGTDIAEVMKEYGVDVYTYDKRPSLHDDATDIAATVSGVCRGWATVEKMKWPKASIVGGITGAQDAIEKAAALQTVYQLAAPTEVARRYGLTEAEAEGVLRRWKTAFVQNVTAWNADPPPAFASLRLDVSSSLSYDEVLEDVSKANTGFVVAGYVIMWAFVVASLFRRNCAHSHVSVGVVGLCLVGLSTAAAIGVFLFVGWKLNATILQVLPFLALGLGVDDMFILVQVFRETPKWSASGQPRAAADVVQEVMGRGGVFVTLTSLCNCLCFSFGALVPLPAVRYFCVSAALVVVFNWAILVVAIPAVLALEVHRTRRGNCDSPLSLCAPCCCGGPGAGEQHAPLGRFELPPGLASSARKVGRSTANCVQRWVDSAFAPWLVRPGTKAFVLILAAALTGACVYGITRVENGLSLPDVMPKDHYLYGFAVAREAHFNLFGGTIVTTDEFDYTSLASQRQFLSLIEDLGRVEWVRNANPRDPPSSWMGDLLLAANNQSTSAETKWLGGLAAGEAVTGLVPKDRTVASTLLRPDAFYPTLAEWSKPSELTYVAEAYFSDADLFSYVPPPPGGGGGGSGGGGGPAFTLQPADDGRGVSRLAFTATKFQVAGMRTTDDYARMIEDVRAVVAKHNATVPAFPTGEVFTYWEQYVALEAHFWRAFGWCLFAILVGALAVLCDPVAAGFITLSSGLVVIQLYGCMAAFGMKMSAIPAVSLIMALGIAVEFTSHLCSAFTFADGTRDERARKALAHVFIPVLQGGLSSMLGFVMLGFSDFRFIRKYFFGLYTLVVVVGLLNGMVVLPVLLSIFGPTGQSSAGLLGTPAGDTMDDTETRAVVELTQPVGGGGGGRSATMTPRTFENTAAALRTAEPVEVVRQESTKSVDPLLVEDQSLSAI